MGNVKVSVVIPVYNEEVYLKECLDSVFAQTLRQIEIICVDDGSTDSSMEILQSYADQDTRIILLKQENKYAGTARNLGMKHAKGKYLCFLDADDTFSPVFLEKMYLAAEAHASDVVICNCNNLDSDTGRITAGLTREKFLPEDHAEFSRKDIPERLFQITDGWPWNKLFLADFIRRCELSFSETRTANDGYFVFMALAEADRITKIDDYLINWRINNQNSLSNTRERSWHCGFEMLYDIKFGLERTGLYDTLKRSLLNFALEYVLWSIKDIQSWHAKENIFYCIQNECKQKLGITELDRDYYYDAEQYEQYTFIENHFFGEYVGSIFESQENAWQKREKMLQAKMQQMVWPFPYSEIEKDSRIVLYGAGQVGQDYYCQISENGYCNIVLWMDKKFEGKENRSSIEGWKDDLKKVKYDKIVVALLNHEAGLEVKKMLKEWGISEEKIVSIKSLIQQA